MKKSILFTTSLRLRTVSFLALSSLLAAPAAWALYNGPMGDVWIEAAASVRYDSNVYSRGESDADEPDPNAPTDPEDPLYTPPSFRGPAEAHDWITTVTPTLHYRRDEGIIHLNASVGYEILRFGRFDEENAENLKTELVISGVHGPDRPFEFNLRGSFDEETRTSSQVNTLVHEEVAVIGGEARYNISERFGVGGSAFYSDNDIKTPGFIDNETVGGGITGYYRYSEKLDFMVGYRHRDTKVGNLDEGVLNDPFYRQFYLRRDPETGLLVPINDEDVASTDDFLFVGASGNIYSKLDGAIRIGWQQRDYDSNIRHDEDGLFVETSLDWMHNEKTTYSLIATRDRSTTPAAETELRTVIGLGVQHRLLPKLILEGGVEYQDSDFTRPGDDIGEDVEKRSDSMVSFLLGATYLLSEQTTLFARASHLNRSSGLQATDYTRFVGEIGIIQLF